MSLCTEPLPLRPKPVFQLHASARILIASQAPGRRVHETRVPFDDPSDNRLGEWIIPSRKVGCIMLSDSGPVGIISRLFRF